MSTLIRQAEQTCMTDGRDGTERRTSGGRNEERGGGRDGREEEIRGRGRGGGDASKRTCDHVHVPSAELPYRCTSCNHGVPALPTVASSRLPSLLWVRRPARYSLAAIAAAAAAAAAARNHHRAAARHSIMRLPALSASVARTQNLTSS